MSFRVLQVLALGPASQWGSHSMQQLTPQLTREVQRLQDGLGGSSHLGAELTPEATAPLVGWLQHHAKNESSSGDDAPSAGSGGSEEAPASESSTLGKHRVGDDACFAILGSREHGTCQIVGGKH